MPTPGTYRCHNCREVIEITGESGSKNSLSDANTVLLENTPPEPDSKKRKAEFNDDLLAPFCRRHRNNKAARSCNNCGDLMCEECSIRLDEKYYCPDCIRKIQEVSSNQIEKTKSAIDTKSSIPLENITHGSFLSRFFLTVKEIFLNYANFFSKTERDGSLGIAVAYGVIIVFLYDLARFLAVNVFGLVPEKPAGDTPPIIKEIYDSYANPTVQSLLLSPFTAMIGLVLLAAIYHLGVLLAKGEGSFKTTFKIACYASSSQLINIVFIPAPMIGTLIAFLAGIIFVTQGCIKLHNFSEGKAIFVALFPTILLLLFLFAGFLAFVK